MLKFYHSILICFLGISLFSHAMETRSIVEIAATGSEDEIITLVNDGFDTDRIIKHNGYRGTLLQWAVKRGQDNAIKQIIRSTQARHPEDIIATGTEQAIISLIRSRYFDINRDIEHDGEHGTVLHWAARRGFVKVFDYIKAKFPGTNFNPPIMDGVDDDSDTRTPLFLACGLGKICVLDWYKNNFAHQMGNNPNPSIGGRYHGCTLLHYAAIMGQTVVFDWYRDNFPDLMNSNPNRNNTDDEEDERMILNVAAYYNRPEIFDWYYKNYPDAISNPARSKRATPLGIAATSKHDNGIEIIEWLAKHKFDLDVEHESDELPTATALGLAIHEENFQTTQYLVFLGASLKGTWPPKMFARTAVMQDYLELTAPKTQRMIKLCRLLADIAKNYEDLRAAKQRGATAESTQEPPLKKRQTSTAAANSTPDNPRLYILNRFLPAIGNIIELAQEGAEIDTPMTDNGRQLCANTPLHGLANTFFDDRNLDDSVLRLIHWLIETKHANINAINLDGNTPLTVACAQGNRVLVQFLLEHGADPTIGNNPLVIALEHNTHSKIFPIFKNTCRGLRKLSKDPHCPHEQATQHNVAPKKKPS